MRKSVEFGRALKVIEYNRVSFPCRSEARGTSGSEFTPEPNYPGRVRARQCEKV